MSNLRIVPGTEADVPVVLDLIRSLAEYERLAHLVKATEEQLHKTLFCERPAAEVLLAHWDAECAGFALFFPTYSTFLAQPGLYLEDLFIKPQFRRKGIGLALFRHLARIAIERACGRLEWEVLDWNEPAIRFYEKLGAAPLSDWTRYRLSDDALRSLSVGLSQ